MKKHWILVMLLLLVFAATAKLNEVGKAVKVIGDVKVIRNGQEIALNGGDAIYDVDKIVTAAGSVAYLKFNNGNFIKLRENRYVSAADLVKEKITYKWLKKVPKSKLSKDKFLTQMPVSTAGVRGAEKAKKSKLSAEYIWVETEELQK